MNFPDIYWFHLHFLGKEILKIIQNELTNLHFSRGTVLISEFVYSKSTVVFWGIACQALVCDPTWLSMTVYLLVA